MQPLPPVPLSQRAVIPWRGLTLFCVTLALCVSLASRTVNLKISDRPAVANSAQKAKIQHLDKDAFSWTSPVSAFALFLAVAPHNEAIVDEAAIPFRGIDPRLYNRPPPLS
jgi:hypothetical protein